MKEKSEVFLSSPIANGEGAAQRRREGHNSVTRRRLLEAPATPGSPVFSFGTARNLARRSFPSKWDDAEKWVINSSCIEPQGASKTPKWCERAKLQMEKSRLTEEKVADVISNFDSSQKVKEDDWNVALNGMILKDKFPDVDNENSEPFKEGFSFRSSNEDHEKGERSCLEMIHRVKHRDAGTEMTPLGSCTTSRSHTPPLKISSPTRHNTPESWSGSVALADYACTDKRIDISQLQECHFSKLKRGLNYESIVSNWSSKEEEEEEVSRSLRHFETGIQSRKSVSDSKTSSWVEEEKSKHCLRYQREEAQIQAWVDLQCAKGEAQSKKLEVKIQKMRSDLEEKLMKRMTIVHKKAEEWRAMAHRQHLEHIQFVGRHNPHKMMIKNNFLLLSSCGCFPCARHD